MKALTPLTKIFVTQTILSYARINVDERLDKNQLHTPICLRITKNAAIINFRTKKNNNIELNGIDINSIKYINNRTKIIVDLI